MATLFEYVDESGQDTGGVFFVVSMLITGAAQEALLEVLLRIEKESKKRNRKWHGSDPRYRETYLEAVSRLKELTGKLFFEEFSNRKDYLTLTATAAAHALRRCKGDRAVVYVDGLRESQVPKFKKQLKPSLRIPAKVQGVRKDENNVFIRLADAICGVVRDAHQKDKWAQMIVKRLMNRDILTEL